MGKVNKLHKMLSIFIGLIFFTVIFIQVCSGNISVYPREVSIPMNEEFIWENSSKKITIENNGDQSVNVSWYLEHPDPIDWMRQNRTIIPNLSWIDAEPKWCIITPHGSKAFYIYLYVPKREENIQQHWETWITFKQESSGGIFNQEYAVRVYMDTPTEIAFNNQSQGLPMSLIMTLSVAIIVIIGIGACFVIVRIIRTKKKK